MKRSAEGGRDAAVEVMKWPVRRWRRGVARRLPGEDEVRLWRCVGSAARRRAGATVDEEACPWRSTGGYGGSECRGAGRRLIQCSREAGGQIYREGGEEGRQRRADLEEMAAASMLWKSPVVEERSSAPERGRSGGGAEEGGNRAALWRRRERFCGGAVAAHRWRRICGGGPDLLGWLRRGDGGSRCRRGAEAGGSVAWRKKGALRWRK